MASKIMVVDSLDESTLDNFLLFVGSLIKSKYQNHKLDITIGLGIQTNRGGQKIELVARKTDFKEPEDGNPALSSITGTSTSPTGNTETISATSADTDSKDGQIHNSSMAKETKSRTESNSDSDPGDEHPPTKE